jgi:hypothetical protein
MYGDLAEEAVESELYGHMKCSQGGIMLLVRLRAQLDRYPPEWLEAAALAADATDVVQAWDDPALRSTLGWLERKFGHGNAVRALRETVQDIFEANGALHLYN